MKKLSAWPGIALGAILLFISLSTFAHAADVFGRIKGTVTDPSGAVVPNVTVTATNEATGVVFNTVTTAGGDYSFQALPIGTYTVSANTTGFKGFTAKGIILNIDQEYVQPIHLSVGSSSDMVSVEADSAQVNTTEMQLSNVVTSAQIVELPLIGRAFTQLEQIEPGIQSSSDRFGSYSANGAQTQQSSYLINGADTNDLALNTITFQPNIDALDQFNLITGPLNAEYDRNSGGIVSATIKNGTNHFHGDVFEFYRDTFLNTRNFFQQSVSPYHQNIFGGTIGGPAIKDKLFFFGAYQGIRQRVPQTGGTGINVYSQANLTGNYSTDLKPAGGDLGYSFSTNPIPGTITIPGCPSDTTTWSACAQKLGGVFPTSTFNPVSVNLIKKFVPAATVGNYGYTFNPITTTSTNQQIYRGDWVPTSKNLIYGVYIRQTSNVSDTLPFTGGTLPGFGDFNNTGINQITLDYTRTINTMTVNDFAVHYTRFNYLAVEPQNVVAPSSLGFAINPQNTAAQSVPLMTVSGFFTLGFSNNGPQPRIDQTYQLDDNFSRVMGHHTLKLGYDGRKFQVSNPFGANNNGNYAFTNSGSSPFSTGDPSLDFLLGVPGTYSQGSGATIQAYAYLNYMYGQDSWKVSNNFTLNYGLGYQIDTVLHNIQYGSEAMICLVPNQQSKVFTTAPLGFNYPGDPGCTNSAQAYTRYGNLGPRFGFAWSPNLGFLSDGDSKKLSIFGGFGIYYNRSEEETSLNNLENPPFGLSSSGAIDFGGQPSFVNPYLDIDAGTVYKNKFPYNFPKPGQTIDYSIYEPMSISSYAPGFQSPYAENFQVTIQRELVSHTVLSIGYIASLGRHNQMTYEGSPITAAGHAACLASTTCSSSANRPLQSYFYPSHTQYGAIDPITGITGFTSVGYVSSGSSSNYNSLQISANKSMSHGLAFQASYTYSHAMDTASNYENAGYGGSARGYNQFQPSLNYGDSQYDARNRFVFAPIYMVPFRSSGGTFSPMNLLVSGWQVSGIMTFASGFPYDISYGGTSSNSLWCSADFSYYACPDIPNQIAPLVRTSPRTFIPGTSRTGWFSGASFAPEVVGSFGDVHRNPYHGGGFNNTNIILAKNFALSADGVRRLQLRMETDNVFNHTQFALPNGEVTGFSTSTGLPTGSFGQVSGINSNTAARQTQLAAKIYF
jgi:hypothetical protein